MGTAMRALPAESPAAAWRRPRAMAPAYLHAAGSLASGIGAGALALWGMRRKGVVGKMAAVAGGALAVRAAAGALPLYRDVILAPVRIQRSVTINKSPGEVYRFWHNVENIPHFMREVESASISDNRIHVRGRRHGDRAMEWDMIVDRDVPDQYISWHTAGGIRSHAGAVAFRPAPGNRGCEVIFEMAYRSPVGEAGRLAGKLRGRDPGAMVSKMLHRLKQVVEAGEIPTTRDQPRGV
jgi:uncharacterized membrane protein